MHGLTCNYITDCRTSYTFRSTGETRHITHHIDCNSKNVIYMVHCNRCHKQYIGETKRRLFKKSETRKKQVTHSNTNPAVCSTLRMRTAISPWQWQPWTAVSSLLGLISMCHLLFSCFILKKDRFNEQTN